MWGNPPLERTAALYLSHGRASRARRRGRSTIPRPGAPMPRTNENYLRWQFGRSVKKGHAPNVTMLPAQGAPDIELRPGEHPIAAVSLASGGPPLVVTDARLVRAGQTLLEHEDVRHCEWIARDPERMNLDPAAAQKMKLAHYDRLIFGLNGRREVVLEGLGQAYSPLLKFFWFKLGRTP
jgi:hypothetical protein